MEGEGSMEGVNNDWEPKIETRRCSNITILLDWLPMLARAL
jgi:hypothetical protein